MTPKPIAVSDSANFYVFCERVFDPTLKDAPVIVLFNNDGCAVARKNAAHPQRILVTSAVKVYSEH